MRKSFKRILAFITAISIVVVSLVSAFAAQENNADLTDISVDGDSCAHTQYVWVTNVPSTCTTDGEEYKVCTSCNAVIETRDIPATDHDEGVWTVSIEATCLENGEEVLTCTSCGKAIDTRVIPATGHDEGIWKVDFEPSPEHEGQMSRYCSKCDAVLETKSFTAHNHTEGFRKAIAQPTCTNDGMGGVFCGVCGSKIDSYVIPALGHLYSEWYMNNDSTHSRTCSRCQYNERNSCVFTSSSYSSTCTESGYAEHVCDICSYTIKEHYDYLGHDWSPWIEDSANNTHTRYCQRHGCDATETKSHNWSEWVYKEKQKEICSYEYLMVRRCHECGALQEKREKCESCCPTFLIIGGTVIGATVTGIISAWNAAVTTASVVGGVSALWLFVKYLLPELQKLHSVTYRVDGDVYRYHIVKEGEPVPVPEDPESPGRIFDGWGPEVPEIMPDHDLVFDAKWKEPETEEVITETVIEETVVPETGSASSKVIAASATAGIALVVVTLLKKKKEEI